MHNLVTLYHILSGQRSKSATEELAASRRFFASSNRESEQARFFSQMGMDRDILEPMLSSQHAADPHWSDMIESLTDVERDVNVETEQTPVRLQFVESKHEKNTRIHKWLVDVRKAANSHVF